MDPFRLSETTGASEKEEAETSTNVYEVTLRPQRHDPRLFRNTSDISPHQSSDNNEQVERNSKSKRSYDSVTPHTADKEQCLRTTDEKVQALLSLSSFRDEAGEGGSKRDIEPSMLPQSVLNIQEYTSKVKGVPKCMITVTSPLHPRQIKLAEHKVSVRQRIRVTEVRRYFQLGDPECPKTFSRGILIGDIGTVTGINYAARTAAVAGRRGRTEVSRWRSGFNLRFGPINVGPGGRLLAGCGDG